MIIGISKTRASFFVLVSFIGMGMAFAQTQVIPLASRLVERFSDSVPTSGHLVVGVQWGLTNAPFSQQTLAIFAGKNVKNRRLCVRVSTRDGRYRALGEYDIAADSVRRPQLQFRSEQYASILEKMNNSSFAIRAVLANECSDNAQGTLVPVAFDGSASSKLLVALLNAPDATVTAEFYVRGELASKKQVLCSKIVQGSSTGFSSRCVVELTGTPADEIGELRINIERMSGQARNYSFPIALPDR